METLELEPELFHVRQVVLDDRGRTRKQSVLDAEEGLHDEDRRLVAEGDQVVGYFKCSGTHQGQWRGRPPTGRRFEDVDEIYSPPSSVPSMLTTAPEARRSSPSERFQAATATPSRSSALSRPDSPSMQMSRASPKVGATIADVARAVGR